MSHTTTITTGGGNIRHHNAIATEPGFRVQILMVKSQTEDDRKFIFQLGARDYNFWVSKLAAWLR